jgi:hypothetical protein
MTNGLAQALNGNFASLTKSGFVLDKHTKELIKNGTEAERAAALAKVLGSTYQGFAEGATQTAIGRQIMLNKALEDIQKTIASAVIPIMDDLKLRLYRQWFWVGHGTSPFVRIDHHPALLVSSAAAVLLLEICFIGAIFLRRQRNLFAAAAFIFHWANAVFVMYPFYQLRTSLAIFLNWSRQEYLSMVPSEEMLKRNRFALMTYAFVLFAVFVSGATNFVSWPFSAYPHFAKRFESVIKIPEIVATTNDGKVVDVKSALRELVGQIDPVRWQNRIDLRLFADEDETVQEELSAIWSDLQRKMDLSEV